MVWFPRMVMMVCFLLLYGINNAQNGKDQVYVDKMGIMRWSKDKSELHGFGVNYTLPFAHEYRMALRRGIPPEEAIRQDVYHMARLDLDFYRVHIWDTEISDTLGNLIDNEHLKLFDMMIREMKARGMKFILTPIAYWGNGWPEPDEKTPGFSCRYGKEACLTNPEAIKAQANYLNQFVSHVNPYTGKAYKDDPAVIAFEISNEPHHGGSAESVTTFINTMVSSIRKAGCTKPVFYNMSHSIHLAQAYLDADIQGGTFQWYPTGLVAGHQINGNFLSHVASYPIPFAGNKQFQKLAKIVYEFDAADAGGNYMYPAMAATFRKTGMQMAAQFAYDALCNAPWNTNYGTHFMNLAYAPKKAISLKIASAVFHDQPMYQSTTGSLHVSYENDLAEWLTQDKFFYSNNTSTVPEDPSSLREIAGCGSSVIVNYTGTGAYFLDKLADGVWRLEVMPDAYWIRDPYSPVSPDIQKAAVNYAIQSMTLDLPDLGKDFTLKAVNKGNLFSTSVSAGKFQIMPGVYLLNAPDTRKIEAGEIYRNIRIDEFVAPPGDLKETEIRNYLPSEATSGKSLKVFFDVISPTQVRKAEVILSNGRIWKTIICSDEGNGRFSAMLPMEVTGRGILNYQIIIEDEIDTTIFPGGIKGSPYAWENRHSGNNTIRFINQEAPLEIWDPETDWEYTMKIWHRDVTILPSNDGGTELTIKLNDLPASDPVNPSEKCYAFKYFFGDKISGRKGELAAKKYLAFEVINNGTNSQRLEFGLVDQKGSINSAAVSVNPGDTICKLPLESFLQGSLLIIPRPYPDFLPFRTSGNPAPFVLDSAETLQVSVLQGSQSPIDLVIKKIYLE